MRFSHKPDDVFSTSCFRRIDRFKFESEPQNHPRVKSVNTFEFCGYVGAVRFDFKMMLTISNESPGSLPVYFEVKLPILSGKNGNMPGFGKLCFATTKARSREAEIIFSSPRRKIKSADAVEIIGLDTIEKACEFFKDVLCTGNTRKKLKQAALKSDSSVEDVQIQELEDFLAKNEALIRDAFKFLASQSKMLCQVKALK